MFKENGLILGPQPDGETARPSITHDSLSKAYPMLSGWRRFRIGKWFPFAPEYPVMVRENPVNKNPQDQEIEFWKLRELHLNKQVGVNEGVEVRPGEFDEGNIIPVDVPNISIAATISRLGRGFTATAFLRQVGFGNRVGDEVDRINAHAANLRSIRGQAQIEVAQIVSMVTAEVRVDRLLDAARLAGEDSVRIPYSTFADLISADQPVVNRGASRFLDWFRSVRKTPYAPVAVQEGSPYIGTSQEKEELSGYAPIPIPGDFQKQTEAVPEDPRKESSIKFNIRKALQKAFKLHIKTERHARKQPELYKITRNETWEAIAGMDERIIRAAVVGIPDESLLTNTATNRRLRSLFKFSKEEIVGLGESDKARLKAAKVILTSIARSKAAHKARNRRQVVDDTDWTDSQVALEMENGISEAGPVEDGDSFENEYERVDPNDYRSNSGPTDMGGISGYNGRNGRINGTHRPTAQPPRNGTGRRVAPPEPSRPPIILNARGLPSSNPVFQESMAPINSASARVAVGVMERPDQEADTTTNSVGRYLREQNLTRALGLVQMSTVDPVSVAGMHGENGEAQVVLVEPQPDQQLTLDTVLQQLSEYGKTQIAADERGRLQAIIDFSDPIARAALGSVDLDFFDVVLQENSRLIIRDLVVA